MASIKCTLGRQTSTKLIRHVTLSLVECITGRRTAADYPTATEAHGFDPSVSELLDTEFRKVDGSISPSFLSVMSYIVGASCSIIIPTPERGESVFGLASVGDRDSATSRTIPQLGVVRQSTPHYTQYSCSDCKFDGWYGALLRHWGSSGCTWHAS